MPFEIVMPKFGLTMQEGKIQHWCKAEGEAIAAGEALFEVETEKVLYEVPSPAGGVVAKLLYPAEAVVACAKAVALIAVDGEDPAAVAATCRPAESDTGSFRAAISTAGPPFPRSGAAIVATPAARKLARDRGVDLAAVTGTGPGGRVTREDVEAALAATATAGSPLQSMRKSIAERMLTSLQSTAQLTLTTEADVTALVGRRQRLSTQFPVTFTDLIIEAVAAALAAHPRFRVTFEHELLRVHDSIDIGIAVALDEGLIVPVLRQADRKPLRQIAEESKRLADAARRGGLGVDDVRGGIFTITNLGMYGIDAFTPILNLPQVAILGVGWIVEKPAVHEGQIAIRSMMTLSFTFDHRIIDGAPAAAFLKDIVDRLSGTP